MTIHPLLPELTRLQRRDRYLAPDALEELSKRLAIPVNQIISVASFYQAFRFKPCGKHRINVCVGAACYVKGAEHVYEAFRKHLNIPEDGDTSPDGLECILEFGNHAAGNNPFSLQLCEVRLRDEWDDTLFVVGIA